MYGQHSGYKLSSNFSSELAHYDQNGARVFIGEGVMGTSYELQLQSARLTPKTMPPLSTLRAIRENKK